MRPHEATASTDARERDTPPPKARIYELPRARPRPSHTLIRACRPRQWVKNALLCFAAVAAGVAARPAVAARVSAAIVAFCLLASATYLFNDVRDREQDRRHPRKRLRPVAAGELAPDQALRAAVVLAAAGTAVAVAVRPLLGVVAISYLALTLSYSLWWRRVVVADLLAVAAGFVLRAIAGGVAAGVYLSEPFLVVTSACALFLVTGKRYAELTRPAASIGRATLNRYSPGALWVVLTGAAATAAFAYGAWAFDRPDRGPWFELSMVAFVVWLGRYAAMLASGAGESPEELILGDRALLVISAVWCLLFAGGAYAGA